VKAFSAIPNSIYKPLPSAAEEWLIAAHDLYYFHSED
jgi:hypothetical protein